jgi:nucleoside 2-deoxyribosyltransferase
MKKPSIYLAGPITGMSYDSATDWRAQVKTLLEPDIDCFSPLRSKQYLLNQTSIKDTYDEYVLSTQRGIFLRDFHDCRVRDLLFVNLLNTSKVSIGTVMEIAWGAAFQKPIVLIMEKNDNIHEHALIREACPIRVETIEEAIFATRALLLP